MLKFLRFYAMSKKGWRTDRHRLHTCTERLASTLLRHIPAYPRPRILIALSDLTCWASCSLALGGTTNPQKLLQGTLNLVENCLELWNPDQEIAAYGGVGKPWMLFSKAKILTEQGFTAMDEGDISCAKEKFQKALEIEFESSEALWE